MQVGELSAILFLGADVRYEDPFGKIAFANAVAADVEAACSGNGEDLVDDRAARQEGVDTVGHGAQGVMGKGVGFFGVEGKDRLQVLR